MFNLSETSDSEQALQACREWHREEQARLLAEYEPCEDCPDDPAEWPIFDPALDSDTWELGPPPAEEPAYEPGPEDREWLAPLDIADDLDDLMATAVWIERLEAMNAYTDMDLMAAGLPVG